MNPDEYQIFARLGLAFLLGGLIGLERETNPFLRAASAEQLAERRNAKDSFTG